MANNLQRLIYNLSITSPLFIIFSLIWIIQKKSWVVPVSCVVIAGILIACMMISFSYGKKHLAPITIRTISISPRDNWIIAYIVTYAIPLTSFVINKIDIVVYGVIGFVLITALSYSNTPTPNPILYLLRYHFYSVSAENGVSDYVLICKRKLRNKDDVKTVSRVFEFLLLDTEE